MQRTKSNFEAVKGLMDKYKPAARGIVSPSKEALIRAELELDARSDLEVQDIRDAAVMIYGQSADALGKAGNTAGVAVAMDAMSAVCAVVDNEKARRGMPV